eukprot:1162084-Pelagomonas_calceolata.AAC.1
MHAAGPGLRRPFFSFFSFFGPNSLFSSKNEYPQPGSGCVAKGVMGKIQVHVFRVGQGYIDNSAYKGSLAEAKGACNQIKPNL